MKLSNLPFGSSVIPLNVSEMEDYSYTSIGIDTNKYDHFAVFENNCQDGYRLNEKFKKGKISQDSLEKIFQSYYIKQEMIGENLDQKILIFSGINYTDSTKTIIVDENMNKLLSDDRKYIYKLSDLNNYTNQQTENYFSVTVDGFDGIKKRPSRFIFRISPFDDGYGFKDSVSKYLQIYIRPYFHREGSLTINHKRISFAITNQLNYLNFKHNLTLIIPSDSGRYAFSSFQNPPYKIKDTILISGEKIRLDSISYLGDTLYTTYLGKSNEKTGITEGLYAYNIREKDAYGRTFELYKQKGKIVLIDFWGTWCVPCKEVLPDLRDVYNKYKGQNFVMVSIALENTENLTKWNQTIFKEKMQWIQIAESRIPTDHSPTTNKFKIQAFPSFLLINEKGMIIKRNSSVQGFAGIKQYLAKYFESSNK